MYRILIALALIVSSAASQADTVFSCSVNAFKPNHESLSVDRYTARNFICEVNIVYVNVETGEEQEVVRHCAISKADRTVCEAMFDDAEIVVGHPQIAAIRGYSKASGLGRFINRACVANPSDLVPDSDEIGNHTISITQTLYCAL